MIAFFRPALLSTMILFAASVADAGEVKISLQNGRVTLVADNAPVRQILAEWARVGQAKIVNAEKLGGAPLTLQLIDMPEGRALETLLRSASGYMLAARTTPVAGASQFDRILILASSVVIPSASAPSPSPARPAPSMQPSMNAPAHEADDDEVEEEPEEDEPDNPANRPLPPGVRPGMLQPANPDHGGRPVPSPGQALPGSTRPGVVVTPPTPTNPGLRPPTAPPTVVPGLIPGQPPKPPIG